MQRAKNQSAIYSVDDSKKHQLRALVTATVFLACFYCLALFASQRALAGGTVMTPSDGKAKTGGSSAKTGCANGSGHPTDVCCAPDSSTTDGNTSNTQGQNGCGGSLINNLNLRFFHTAVDYAAASSSSPGGCSSCGGTSLSNGDDLPSLTIERYHRYRYGTHSSFGPGVASNYDLALWLDPDGSAGGGGTAVLYDDGSVDDTINLTDKSGGVYDGIYTDNTYNVVRDLRTYDSTGALVVNQHNAVKAVVTTQKGRTYTFEVYSTSPTGQILSRLTRITDRNGNSTTISYQYTGSTLPVWAGIQAYYFINTVTDAHGKVATFHYSIQHGAGNLYLVDNIKLPARDDGTLPQLSYTYGAVGAGGTSGSTMVGLTGVTEADGTTSTFSSSYDATSQCVALQIFDAGAAGIHRNKTIYLTQSTWTDPSTGTVYSQVPFQQRMIINGSNEVSYMNWTTTVTGSADIRTFVYQGGGSLMCLQRTYTFNPHMLFYKLNATMSDYGAQYTGTLSPTDWEQGYQSVGYDSLGQLNAETDAAGHLTSYTNDANGAPAKITYADGTNEQIQYASNDLRWPTLETDRLGRQTSYTLDANGNILSKTTAAQAAPAQQSTWSWTYNTRGQKLTATDANGNVTTYAYYENATDAGSCLYKLKTVTEPPDSVGGAQAVTTFTYDAVGRLKTSTDPVGRVTTYTYDDRNRVTQVTYADTSSDTYVYGTGVTANLLVSHTDRVGDVETFAYDLAGRKVTHVTASGTPVSATESWTYLDGTENAATYTDRGNTTTYAYDDQLRQTGTMVQPNGTTSLTSHSTYDDAQMLAYTTDNYGRRTAYEYDINNRVIRAVTETAPGILSIPSTYAARNSYLAGLPRVLTANAGYLIHDSQYNAEGQDTQTTNGNGNNTTYAYDAQARQTDVIEAAGTGVAGHTQTVYDAQGNVTDTYSPRNFTEAGGFDTHMTYTGRNLLASRTEAFGRPEAATHSFTYYLDRRANGHTDFNGNLWTTTWGFCCGRIQAQIEPLDNVDGSGTNKACANTTRHNDAGDLTHEGTVIDITVATFPTLANPTNVTNLGATNVVHEITTRYDARHRKIAQTVWLHGLGAVNGNDPPIAGGSEGTDPPVIDPGTGQINGLTTTWTYDENLTDGMGIDATYAAQIATLGAGFFGPGCVGSAIAVTNPNNETSVMISDAMGRVVMTIDGLGHATKATYDAMVTGISGAPGSLLSTVMTDPLSHTNTMYADGAGRTLDTRDAENKDTTMGYDADSNQLSVRDPNGVGQNCLFDARNRKTQCTDTHGDVNKWTYDANNNITSYTDNKGASDVSIYDGRDRRTSYTSRLATDTTTYAFDANSNLLTLADSQSGVTSYTYGSRNLKTLEAYPDDDSHIHTGFNDHVSYTYDAAHRISTKIDQIPNTILYVFNMADWLTQRTYPDANNDTFTYDLASRMLTAVSARYADTVTRAYDAAGRMTADNLTIGGNTYDVGFGFDAADRLTSITYPDGSAVSRSYWPRDLPKEVDYTPNGGAQALVAKRNYDNGQRLVTTTLGNGLVESRAYRNDPGGLIDNMISSISVPGVTGFNYSYDANKNKTAENDSVIGNYSWSTGATGYDAKDRLTNWSRTNGDSQTWNLSLVGDWTNTVVNGTTDTRTHNAVHELLTRSTSPTALVYDAKGNLTTNSNSQTYTWDFDNQMTQAVNGATTANYAYDALGRRVSKTIGATTTIYVSASQQEVAEYANGTLTTKYIYGTYVDEPLMLVSVSGTSETTYYYHANALYCISALTNSAGNIVERYEYSPYGKAIISTNAGPDGIWFTADDTYASSSTLGNPFTYTGRRLDAETGLYYYRARCYDADTGRFISRDAMEYVDCKDLYSYVGGNPGTELDANGNCKCAATRMNLVADHWFISVPYAPDGNNRKVPKDYRGGVHLIFRIEADLRDKSSNMSDDVGYKATCCKYFQWVISDDWLLDDNGYPTKPMVPNDPDLGSPNNDSKWHLDNAPYKGDDDLHPNLATITYGHAVPKTAGTMGHDWVIRSVDAPGVGNLSLNEHFLATFDFIGYLRDTCNNYEYAPTNNQNDLNINISGWYSYDLEKDKALLRLPKNIPIQGGSGGMH